jgi:hypothetical protein
MKQECSSFVRKNYVRYLCFLYVKATQQRECIRGDKRTVRSEQLIHENDCYGQSTKTLYTVGIRLHVSATKHEQAEL